MSQFFAIHPETPQLRLVRQAVEILRGGGVIAYPTDSAYALGCRLGDKRALECIRRIRKLDDHHNFTLVCPDLSVLGTYAKVDNSAYRLIKNATPGPYTFILEATGEVPRRLLHPRRKTVGVRVPDNAITQALLAEFAEPIMSVTLQLPGDDYPLTDPYDIRTTLEHEVELVIDGGFCGLEPTTVIDLSADSYEVLREGFRGYYPARSGLNAHSLADAARVLRYNSLVNTTIPPDAPDPVDESPTLRPADRVERRLNNPQQGEMPFAIVMGHEMTELPKDLYIPPQALEVFLEAFEGPLDLLLYLIRRQNLDILDIGVSQITTQYMEYVELMDAMQFELAAEYLLMAAMLAEIKSRMLLPRSTDIEEDEEDPRANLIRRLQEYERFKQAAEEIDGLPRVERDTWVAKIEPPDLNRDRPLPDLDMRELLVALGEVLKRADMYESHQIQRESLSTRERMSDVLEVLRSSNFVPFVSLFKAEEGRLGVVVTFLAIMELIKESLVEIVQTEGFGPIHVKARID